MMDVPEKDWKLFRKKIGGWQTAYIDRLNREYVALLMDETKKPEERFCELEDRIWKDKKSPGVVVEMRRSRFYHNLVRLLIDHVIEKEDLAEFSDEVKEIVELLMR